MTALWQLIKEKENMLDTMSMAETLKGEYRVAFEKADLYSTMGRFDTETVENKLMHLYHRLREAQLNEILVEEIIGNDIEAFCKEYFVEGKEKKSHKNIWGRVYDLLKWIFIFSVADLLMMGEGENIVTAQSNVAPFIWGVAIGLVICIVPSHFMKPLIFKSKKMKPIHYYVSVIVLFVFALILTMILFGDILIPVNSFPLLIISGGYVGVYLIVRSIWRYRRYGKITKSENEEKKYFNDAISEKTLLRSISEAMVKRFNRINKKKRKQGKPEFSMHEFAALVRKEIKQRRIFNVVFAFLLATLVLVPTIHIMFNDGLYDGFLFGIFMTIVEVAVYIFFFKAEKTNARIETRILTECEEKNISIAEYVEKGYEDGTFL